MQIIKVRLRKSPRFTVFLALILLLACLGVALSGLVWWAKLLLMLFAIGLFGQAARQPWQNLVIYPEELWLSSEHGTALAGLERASGFSTAWFLHHPKVTLFFDQMPASAWACLRSYRQ